MKLWCGPETVGVLPADFACDLCFGAVKMQVSARFFRWQYAHGSSPLHFTFRALHRSHAATTRSMRRRFSGRGACGVLLPSASLVSSVIVDSSLANPYKLQYTEYSVG